MPIHRKSKQPLVRRRVILTTALLILAATAAGCAGAVPKCTGASPAAEAEDARNRDFPKSILSAEASARYEAVRKRIDTRPQFHNSVLAFPSYETAFSFYLLGIEKPRAHSDRPYCDPGEAGCGAPAFAAGRFAGSPADDEKAVRRTREDIRDRLFGDPRSMVLTHALRVRKSPAGAGDAGRDACFAFNVYADGTSAPWCSHRHIANPDAPKWTREGWKGIDRLGDEIKAAADREKPTHIILLATGWNTEQYESFLDFRYWATELAGHFTRAGEEFRPIFVGIAWESAWPSAFWSRLPFSSMSTKGNDADEIGFGWVNYLVTDVLRPIARTSGAQLVAIGHSFGSRIVLGSHYVRDVLVRKGSGTADVALTAIGIQAAFPTGRFVSTKGKEHPYLAANKGSALVVITTSEHDEATGVIAFGTGYVGGPAGLSELRNSPGPYEKAVTLLGASSSGQPSSVPARNRVSVYDASPFVNCELQGTGSGAHSDVYDKAMGNFLGEIIRSAGKMK